MKTISNRKLAHRTKETKFKDNTIKEQEKTWSNMPHSRVNTYCCQSSMSARQTKRTKSTVERLQHNVKWYWSESTNHKGIPLRKICGCIPRNRKSARRMISHQTKAILPASTASTTFSTSGHTKGLQDRAGQTASGRDHTQGTIAQRW